MVQQKPSFFSKTRFLFVFCTVFLYELRRSGPNEQMIFTFHVLAFCTIFFRKPSEYTKDCAGFVIDKNGS